MAKAAKSLSTSTPDLNRRRLLGGASIAMAAIAAPIAARATSHSATLQPSAIGREYLSTLADLRQAWGNHDGSDIEPDGSGSGEAPRITMLEKRSRDFEDRILAKPVRVPADAIDLAIVLGFLASSGFSTDEAAEKVSTGFLSLANLTLSDCAL